MTLTTAALTLEVPGRTLVRNLDLAIRPGETWAVLGANGAGKSSLLAALAGLRRPDGGGVALDGRPAAAWPRRDWAQRIGILLQDEGEDFWGTTLDYVALGRVPHETALFGVERESRAAAREALAAVDLAAHADQAYRSLSGGERQRTRIAQLLVQAPGILLLDEPLNHLDLRHQLGVMERLAALARAGSTIVMALHEPLWAARYCGHALLLYDSARFQHGPAHDVLTQANLEALYGCRLEAVAGPASRLFVPVREAGQKGVPPPADPPS